MKPAKASNRSYKNLISKTSKNNSLRPDLNFGLTIIPIGSDDVFIALPSLRDTYTYNIINTDEMTGAITLKTSGGASLKGLTLNHIGGTLSITPVPQGTTSFEMGSDVKDGCFIQTLSNGNNWFIWSVATHGTLGIGQDGNDDAAPPSSSTTQISAPVTLNPIQTNTTFSPEANFEARHSIIFSGDAEPGATIVISEGSGFVDDISVVVGEDGTWSTNEITDLENEDYTFTFTPSVGEAAIDQEFASDDGVLSFTTPTSFTVERGEAYDFSIGASAIDTNNVAITPFNIDNSQYNTGLAHGATFDIVYSFTHNGTPYTRTVSGVVEDTIAPAKPTIASATFDAVNINDFTATGNAEDGSTVEIFFDGASQGTVTATGGTWTFTKTFTFLQTFNITAQATDAQNNISEESDPTSVVYSPPTLTRPTLAIDNAPANTWSNQTNPIQISGTTDAGSTIVIKSGNQTVTPQSGPTYVGADWSATINVADESNSSLTVEASQANSNSPSPSITKTLLIDRVDPVISGTPLGALTIYLGNIGTNNDNIPTATDFSSATVTSDWSTQVDATEGAKTVTYTATDAASNSATTTRTVNVSTEVIVPEDLTVATGVGTATISGVVSGTYADNLVVKIYVTDGNGLETVYQESGTDVEFPVNSGAFSAPLTLSADDYTFHATTVNSEDEESSPSQETSQVTITAAPDTVIPVITLLGNASESFTEGGSYSDEGATALDGVDGDITSNIVTTIVDSSDVTAVLDSTTAPGVYTIRYDVSDSSNNDAVTVTRTVEVLAAANFLEDLSSITLHGLATISSGIFSRNKTGTGGVHGANFNLEDENIVAFNSDGTRVDEELTVSFWFRPDEAWADNWYYIGGHTRGTGTEFRLAVRDNAGFLEFRSIFFSGTQYKNSPSTSALNTGEWYHLAVTYSANGSNHDLKMFVNGEKVEEDLNLTGNLMKMTNATKDFALGGYTSGDSVGGNSLNHSSDSWQIASGTALTESQVAAIYNQSDRLMTIATAATLHFSADLEEQGVLSGNASLVNGVLVSSAIGDYTSMSNTAAFKSNDYQTISFWFRSTYTPANTVWMRFIHTHVIGGGVNGFFIEMRSPRHIHFKGASQGLPGNSNPAAISPYDLNDGEWHQITLSWEDLGIEKLRIWVDGAPMTVLDEALVGSGNDNKNTLYIGAKQFNSPMEMDKVGITEEFIDDAEALARYNSEAQTLAP